MKWWQRTSLSRPWAGRDTSPGRTQGTSTRTVSAGIACAGTISQCQGEHNGQAQGRFGPL